MQSVTIKDILNEILKKTELCLVDGIEVKTTEVYRKLIEATKGINPVNKRGLDDEIVMFDKAIEWMISMKMKLINMMKNTLKS